MEDGGVRHLQELLGKEVKCLAVYPGRPVRLTAPGQGRHQVLHTQVLHHHVLTACNEKGREHLVICRI